MTIARVLGRYWIPLVIVVVVVCGAFIVSRIHGLFGAEDRPQYTNGHAADGAPSNPKHVVYEVFGPVGTVANINYLDADSQPQQIDGARLPWSLTITVDAPAVVANLLAQGDASNIGCRILVNDDVKAERVSNQVNAFTHCLVQGA